MEAVLVFPIPENEAPPLGKIVGLLSSSFSDQSLLVDVYVPDSKEAVSYPPLPYFQRSSALASLFGHVFVIGGEVRSNAITNMVQVLNLNKGCHQMEWRLVCRMHERRMLHAVTTFKKKIYAAGGWKEDQTAVDTVEYFSSHDGVWVKASPMHESRIYFSLVSCEDFLFAVGGRSREQVFLKSVEMYSDSLDLWFHYPPMQIDREGVSAVSLDDRIYALGGLQMKLSGNKSVETCDVNLGIWTNHIPMRNKRSYFSACVLENNIFVVGGYLRAFETAREIDCFSAATQSWTIAGSLDKPFLFHNTCTEV